MPVLEALIPPVDILSPLNNPFLHATEVSFLKQRCEHRTKIWNKCKAMGTDADSLMDDGSSEDGPPVLEKVEPVIPVSTLNGTPPMPEIQKKQQKAGSTTSTENGDSVNESNPNKGNNSVGRRRFRKSKARSCLPPDVSDGDSMDKADDISVKHVKSLENYFCAFDKTGYGKGFHMMGKSCDTEGEVNYMIKWDQ